VHNVFIVRDKYINKNRNHLLLDCFSSLKTFFNNEFVFEFDQLLKLFLLRTFERIVGFPFNSYRSSGVSLVIRFMNEVRNKKNINYSVIDINSNKK